MNCVICGGPAVKVTEKKPAKYRDQTIVVESELFRCESCKEEFVTPEQLRQHVRAVKDEIRRKHGLLSPEKLVEIRVKTLRLTQAELEELLGTPPKTIVRWESGKVIQSNAHDNMLRLLARDPNTIEKLRQVQKLKSRQQKEYESSHKSKAVAVGGHTVTA